MSKWYDHAWRIILRTVVHECDGNPNPVQAEEVRKKVDALYPFGPQEYLPYKEWLRARRDIFQHYDLMAPRAKRSAEEVQQRHMAEINETPLIQACRERDGK